MVLLREGPEDLYRATGPYNAIGPGPEGPYKALKGLVRPLRAL